MSDLRLLPILVARVQAWRAACARAGINVRLTEGHRTRARQELLYRAGRRAPFPLAPLSLWVVADRSKVVTWALPPRAPHCKAAAVDFCVMVDGRPAWDRVDLFDAAGALAADAGLEWGGRWPHPDRPHLQLPDWATYPEVP